jgi:hypothetical protein
VAQKRALLGGSFGVYNSYTILHLQEIRTWNNTVITDWQPNIAIGQRVIIGDQQTYIYDLQDNETELVLSFGTLTDTVIDYLQRGAAIKVDCPPNRPFPFYRPTAEASADAYFRCSVGQTTRETQYYRYANLFHSPYDQNNLLLPYENLDLFGGSYYYFDRAVYLSQGTSNLAPWIEAQWIESKGLWQIYIPESVIGNQLAFVWDYAVENTPKRVLAVAEFQVVAWNDPSDWGFGGAFFNPVLDEYSISKTYNTAGLNYSLGTRLDLGDNPPQGDNPLWYDAGNNTVYSYFGSQWTPVGQVVEAVQLSGSSAPPPATYDFQAGNIWQSPDNQVYIWDAGFENYDFFYFFSNAIVDGFFIINPSYNIGSLYYYDPDNFLIHCPSFVDAQGLYVYNLDLNDEGFYISNPCFSSPDWYRVEFFGESLFSSVWTNTYSSNIYVLVDGTEIPNDFKTNDYEVIWSLSGGFLSVTTEQLPNRGNCLYHV